MYNGHWALETAMGNEQWTLETTMNNGDKKGQETHTMSNNGVECS